MLALEGERTMDDKNLADLGDPEMAEVSVDLELVEAAVDGPTSNFWSAGTGEDGSPVIQNGRGPEHEIPMPDMRTAERTARRLNRAERKGEKRVEQDENKDGYWDENAGANSDALS